MTNLSILKLPFPRLRRAVLPLLALLILLTGSRAASAGAIYLMSGNGGMGDCVFVKLDRDAGKDHGSNLKDYGANDQARSARLRYVQPGTRILVYDSPTGSTDDDWTEIFVKRAHWDDWMVPFEDSYEDDFVRVTFHKNNGLNGKVSRIEVINDGMRPLVDRRRWMSQHWPLIADKRLIDITLPASHDSGTASLHSELSRWAVTQNLSTAGQLDEGIRAFDYRVEKSGGALIIHHGQNSLLDAKGDPLSVVLSQISGWLGVRQSRGDRELVMVTISAAGELIPEIETAVQTGLARYLFRRDSLPREQRDKFHSTLALKDILSAGPRAVVLISDSKLSDQFWYPSNIIYDEYANMQDSQKMIDDQQKKYQIYDANKLFLLSWTLTENATSIVRHPRQPLHGLAMKANLDLWHVLRGDWGRFDAQGGRRVNLLSMDFVEEAATTDYALALNGWDYQTAGDFWRRFDWSQLQEDDRRNWETLGWTRELWDSGTSGPASDAKKWAQLNTGEQSAALGLGLNQGAWDLRVPGNPQTFPVFKELDITLNPGEWQSWVLEKASLDRAFVAAFSLDKPARNDGFLERHVIRPEWDGKQWNTVLRLQVSGDIGQPLKAKVRIYEISKLPVAAEFTTDLQPEEWQPHVLGTATTDYAYVAAASPVGPGKTGDFLDKLVIQPEWDGTQWLTVLRLQIPRSMAGMKLQVRVYKVAHAPVALAVTEQLKGGEWRGASLGEATVERAYLTAFSAAKPPINAGFLEKHVIQPEWDGQKWISALRTQIPVSLPSLDLNARVFLIRAR